MTRVERKLEHKGKKIAQKVTHGNFIKLAELQSAISVDGRSDIFAIIAVLDGFQLPHTAHVR